MPMENFIIALFRSICVPDFVVERVKSTDEHFSFLVSFHVLYIKKLQVKLSSFRLESFFEMFTRYFVSRITRRSLSTVADLYKGLIAGDRGCLARGITLVESTRPEKQHKAKELLGQALKDLKQRQEKQPNKPISFRIGLNGNRRFLMSNLCFSRTIR